MKEKDEINFSPRRRKSMVKKRSLITGNSNEIWSGSNNHSDRDYKSNTPLTGSRRNKGQGSRVDVISEKEEFNGGDLSHSSNAKVDDSNISGYGI